MDIKKIVENNTLTYRDWCIKNNYKPTYETNIWRIWWNTIIVPERMKQFCIWLESINCSEFHTLLFKDHTFLRSIRKYMKSVKWNWSNGQPKIYQILETILDLSHHSANNIINGNVISTGGLNVKFYPNKFLIVEFTEFHTDKVIFRKEITNKEIRTLKLNNILKYECN